MHASNIAHMDLKLENVMKFDDKFKIIDLESSLDFNSPISNDVNVKSTLSCMSPELYTFDKDNFSTNIDIWSYGMILYEVITGEVIIQEEDQEKG
jgi:serine/threonine protein kinase